MPKALNLVGQMFGSLEVLEKSGHDKYGKVLWKCKCHECGNTTDVPTQGLTSGDYKTCGCEKGNRKTKDMDLLGKHINSLTVVEYVGKSRWKCICDCGNETIKKAQDLKSGRAKTCGKCVSQVKDIIGMRFGKLVAIKLHHVKDGRAFWEFKCDCGRTHIANGKDVREGKIISCGNHSVNFTGSKSENEIKQMLIDAGIAVNKEKTILDGKEIDMYIPELKLGIEYNGSPFHATVNAIYGNNKSYDYHRTKFLQAKEKGVHLINIFDIDWENSQDKIKQYLSYLILPQQQMYARNCEVAGVSEKLACEFVDKWHLQGANKQSMKINYGLWYNSELVAVMSFGKPRLKKQDGDEYELHRYCVKDNLNIVGGAERLFKHFLRDYLPDKIISYSDNDYFLGGIYERLGFSNCGQCKPRYYWYLNGREIKRERCMLKHLKLEYPELLQEAYDVGASNKEDYVMVSLGACKVYRSGNTKWEWRN